MRRRIMCCRGRDGAMEIRQLRRAELADAARVVRGAFATVAAEFGLTQENCPTNGAFLPEGRLEAQFDAGVRMAGAFDGDVMIGFAALDLSDAEKPELEKLAVLPQSRHQGAGKLLVGWAAEQARAAGAAHRHHRGKRAAARVVRGAGLCAHRHAGVCASALHGGVHGTAHLAQGVEEGIAPLLFFMDRRAVGTGTADRRQELFFRQIRPMGRIRKR